MIRDVEARDAALRQRRFEQIREAWGTHPDSRDMSALWRERLSLLPEPLAILDEFLTERTGIGEFATAIDRWSRGKRVFGFAGQAGAMYLNQLANDGVGVGVDELLRTALTPPPDQEVAALRMAELAQLNERMRGEGSAAQIGRIPFFFTWFWWIQEPDRWRPMWPSAARALTDLGWLTAPMSAPGDRWLEFVSLSEHLDEDAQVVEDVLQWFGNHGDEVGINLALPDRCKFSMSISRELPDDSASESSVVEYEISRRGMRSALEELKRVGKLLLPDVEDVLGYRCHNATPPEYWAPHVKRIRGDAWTSWRPIGEDSAPGLRLVVAPGGFYLVVNPEINRNPAGYAALALAKIGDRPDLTFFSPFDYEAINTAALASRSDLEIKQPFNLGVKLDAAKLGDVQGLRGEIRSAAERLSSVVKALVDTVEERPTPAISGLPSDLKSLADRFEEDTGYPSARDKEYQRIRGSWAEMLTSEQLPGLTQDAFRRMIAGRYGSPGPQSILNTTIKELNDEGWTRFLGSIDHLLWGDGELGERITRVLDEEQLGFRGLKETVIMKLLAITFPQRFIPVYPLTGDKGKSAMLKRLGLKLPELSLTVGEQHLKANDTLREQTEPLFPSDPWEQMVFLYWLLEQQGEEVEVELESDGEGVSERLAAAADALFLDAQFLEDIHELIAEKGQVIFYGPPGTGKTYIAQAFAEAIAPDPERRMLIQFHPSTSYEDFFEGFRPESTSAGGLSYRLAPGPLRHMADAAENDPKNRYVLIVDEINRAHLPKVFGELLFLLEYRDRSVRPLYRADEDFSIPENLWIVGTMNTADRSVALLDAAMRRRFHFIPFIPDTAGRSPIAQVLRRWVEENHELETLPDMVDRVNNQLRAALHGDHLLLGPSYFMKPGINEEQLRRIWEYQIEPLIADIFFGEPERIEAFGFDRIWGELGTPAADTAGDS